MIDGRYRVHLSRLVDGRCRLPSATADVIYGVEMVNGCDCLQDLFLARLCLESAVDIKAWQFEGVSFTSVVAGGQCVVLSFSVSQV